MCIIFRLRISKATFRRRQGSEININSNFIIISANKIRRENYSISFRAVLLFAFQFRADLMIFGYPATISTFERLSLS